MPHAAIRLRYSDTLLADELAPREGRGLAVARIAAACTITVAIAMVFRIPLADSLRRATRLPRSAIGMTRISVGSSGG